MRMRVALAVLSLILAGCASFDGRGLVPGQSRAGDVEALMGAPAERVAGAGGDTVWYYVRQPSGQQTYAVRLGANGVLRSVTPLLTEENLKNLVPGSTTRAQVREILGPPWRTTRIERMERDIWEYRMLNATQWDYILYVQMSGDGLVREVMLLKDYSKEPGGDASMP